MTPRLTASVGGAFASLLCTYTLTPLFDGFWWWFGPVLVTTTMAVSVAALGRALRLPFAAGVLLGILGLVVTVTVLCAGDTAIAGLVPTRQTVSAVHTLLTAGQDDISRLAAPVPQRPGLVLLIVVGVHLVVTTVDVLVVTIRRPTLAGLPLLALFAVPAAVLPHGVGPVPFVLGALGFLLLLVMDGQETMERWGKPVTGPGMSVSRNTPGALGVGIAACAMVCAVAVPLMFPSPNGPGLFGRAHGTASAEGPNSAIVIPPITRMSQQLHASYTVPLLSVRTAMPEYLRLTALEQFDGQEFTLRPLRAGDEEKIINGLPPADRGVRATTVSTSVNVSGILRELYLPLPGTPNRIDNLTGDWRLSAETGTVFSTRTSTAGASYQVQASVPDPLPAQLTASPRMVPTELKVDTELPAAIDPRIRTLARDLTRTSANAYEQAVAIQNYLRGSTFTYDLGGAPTTQDNALTQFLFVTRRGYCQQFSAAMTVLMRALGVPARVAIGFLPGNQQSDGSYLITNKEAHAWTEVWFASTGWIAFEPTPRAPEDGGARVPAYAQPPGAAATSAGPTTATRSTTPTPATAAVPSSGTTGDNGPDAQPDLPIRTHLASSPLPWIVSCVLVGTGIVTLLLVPTLLRLVRRRRRLATAAAGGSPGEDGAPSVDARVQAVWDELTDLATDLRMPIHPTESPRATATRLAAYIGASTEVREEDAEAARTALARMASAEELARYAPSTLTARSGTSTERLVDDLLTVARHLRTAAPRGSQARAVVVPPSVVGGFIRRSPRRIPRTRRAGDGDPATADGNAASGLSAESPRSRGSARSADRRGNTER